MSEPQRPIRIANCSGASPDSGDLMYNQATAGPIDVITGDYLAECNMAQYAGAYAAGKHPGYVVTAWDGLQKSLAAINEKRIKIVINGGALNPKGLAQATHDLALERGYSLKVAYVDGDDVLPRVHEILKRDEHGRLPHFDSLNENVHLVENTDIFLKDPTRKFVAANAYLGCRAIRKGLDEGADIIICGRVADASPVMGAAAWWHGWKDDDWDKLAGSLIAGHLIECSTYGTGANFAGFDEYEIKKLLNLGCPIAEISSNGSCVITKHDSLNGIVTEEVVKCQLLYELQGNMYLNSDVKADITNTSVKQIAPNRVRVSGTKGHPPPPTTKLAAFYQGGYQCEITVNATGYATSLKYDLQEAQLRSKLDEWGLTKDIEHIQFQRVGFPETNPRNQIRATTYMRIFIQAAKEETIKSAVKAWQFNFMQHFAGMACTLDVMNTKSATPEWFLGYYPALVSQAELREVVHFIGSNRAFEVGPPRVTEVLKQRDNYDPPSPQNLKDFGPTKISPIGDVLLARSGDKGANVNVGFTPRARLNNPEVYEWLRSFLTRAKIQEMMGEDWRDWFYVERVEFPGIRAVHFVIYGALGRGVSSSDRLDSLGKAFAEFLRAVHVPVPVKFLEQQAAGRL